MTAGPSQVAESDVQNRLLSEMRSLLAAFPLALGMDPLRRLLVGSSDSEADSRKLIEVAFSKVLADSISAQDLHSLRVAAAELIAYLHSRAEARQEGAKQFQELGLGISDLIERGWSRATIEKHLNPPDFRAPSSDVRGRYDPARVQKIEQSGRIASFLNRNVERRRLEKEERLRHDARIAENQAQKSARLPKWELHEPTHDQVVDALRMVDAGLPGISSELVAQIPLLYEAGRFLALVFHATTQYQEPDPPRYGYSPAPSPRSVLDIALRYRQPHLGATQTLRRLEYDSAEQAVSTVLKANPELARFGPMLKWGQFSGATRCLEEVLVEHYAPHLRSRKVSNR